jgi:hypothetical protein
LGIELQELERLLAAGGSRGDREERAEGAEGRGVSVVGARHAEDRRLAAITRVRAEIARLTSEYEVRPTTGLVVRAAGLLTRVEGLRGAEQVAPSRWRRDLDVAEAETCLLVGRLLWDAAGRHDPSTAEELFERAARCAGRAGDSVLQATAVLRSAFLGLYGGDPEAGIRRCVQAAAIAAPVSRGLFALARLHAAEGHALLGRAGECDQALSDAWGAMGGGGADDDPAAGICPVRTYRRLSGAAYLALGRYGEARAALSAATEEHEPGKVLAVVLGQLAMACLGEGDVEAALRYLGAAVELAVVTRAPGAVAVAARAARELMGVGEVERRGAAMEVVDRLLGMSVG